jgi:succinyl-diaminopimelate desuccinylase
MLGFASVREAPAGSAMPFGRENAAALDFFLKLGHQLGFKTENFSGYAGHVEYGQGEEILGVLCHLDVVPPGENWTYPPFGGVIAHDRLYGRGAVDNKGPAMACLYGLAALKSIGFQPQRRIRVIVGLDEESHWECMNHYLQHAEKPSLGFAPDAEFPIINAEKGILVAGVKGALPESRRWQLLSIEGGNRPNMVPDSCRMRLNSPGHRVEQQELLVALEAVGVKAAISCSGPVAELEFSGVSAHASMPHLGDNAVYHALRFLAGLGFGGLVGTLAEKLAFQHDGQGLGIGFADQESGSLTVNLGVIASLGETLDVKLDLRYPVTFSKEQVIAGLRAAIGEVGVVTHEGGIDSLHVPADSELIKVLQRVYQRCTGADPKLIAIGGGTYARAIEQAVAFGPVFPGQPELAHQRDEHITIDDLVKLTWIYAEAMKALAGGEQ